MGRGTTRPPAETTRDRILKAAVLRFSKHSYEETGLRDIASDVGVDVAYVHRCFGSKQRLFAEAMKRTLEPERIFVDGMNDLAGTLARQVFARDTVRKTGGIGPLDISIRSLTCPEAASVLRALMVEDVIDPLSRKLDDPARRRATLIMAFLAGIGIFRNVLRLEVLRGTDGDELEKVVAGLIRRMMGKSPTVKTTGVSGNADLTWMP